ncbi:MAG: PhoU domain-containing protein [Candidatus Korarchaeum sp.]
MATLLDKEIRSIFSEVVKSSELSLQLTRMCVDALLGKLNSSELLAEVDKGAQILSFSHEQVRLKISEVLARFQPMGGDLRKLISLLEISYGLLRLGRYARNIAQTITMFGDLRDCDLSRVVTTAELTDRMVKDALRAVESGDQELARRVMEMDDEVDGAYNEYIRGWLLSGEEREAVCAVANTLILRYLERMADHAVQIAEEVLRMS